ncbi:nitroreductase/quinone reductase family protein [Polymorphospora rubra]|uniref:Cation-binding protein n=1 Tax=Polymorphospora rubra TaxID=338584 RepID=A0A810N3U8_9ACTN|nr:nitroreductase/quinone reductase family protein [Polymorphospora rubra]BCJ67600.1 cation-binding protein [Polymorphospora rubra]
MSENPTHPLGSAPRISDFNRSVVDEFRANGGKVGGLFEGGNLLLLTTTGAKSGRWQTSLLGYVRDGDRLLVVASAGGAPRHPAWYHNVIANPLVRVEVGTEIFEAVAVPAQGAERDRLFAHVVEREPGYGDYQAGTRRRIPVVVLDRVHADVGGREVNNLADKLMEIHDWLRDQLTRTRAEADGYFAARQVAGGPPPVGLGMQIRQHCLAFCQSLHFHHTSEDGHMLPGLERQYPDLAPVIGRLRAEHVTVDRIRRELEELLADVDTADPVRFRAELDRMTAELTAHLAYEEESLIPLLAGVPFPPGGPAA